MKFSGFKLIILKVLRYSGVPVLFRAFFQRNKITVIYYHDINASSFELHIKYLIRHYNIISIDELYDYLRNSISTLPHQSLLITFDDGHAGNYELTNICLKYEISPTIFLTSKMIGSNKPFWFKLPFKNANEKSRLKRIQNSERLKYLTDNYAVEQSMPVNQSLSWENVIEMSNCFDFHSHTHSHPCLPNCTTDEIYSELKNSKELIEKKLNKSCYSIAYPNGDYSDQTINLCKQVGYLIGFTGNPGFVSLRSNPYKLPRLSMNDTNSMDDFIVRSSGLWFFVKRISGIFKN